MVIIELCLWDPCKIPIKERSYTVGAHGTVRADNDDDVFPGVISWQYLIEYYFLLSFQSCVTALDQTWHPEHFVCASCGQPFGETGFHERDGKPFCREDYYAMFAPRCGGCGEPIMDSYISALSAHWHAECFVCSVSSLINLQY